MFSMTILMIILGIMGLYELAADVGIVQAASLMVFLGFSTNARNIILGKNLDINSEQLFLFRLILIVPLAVISYFFCSKIIDLTVVLTIGLILRKVCEWIAEIQINQYEVEENNNFARLFLFIQCITFLNMLVFINNDDITLFTIALYIWALSPVFLLTPFIKKISIYNISRINWRILSPHLGSTWVIGISTFVFRVFIMLLAGKITAGILFSAFAIGGMINSFYVYAIGPTLVSKDRPDSSRTEKKITLALFISLISSGLITCGLGYSIDDNSSLFIFATGMSLVGSAFMLLAQRYRIHIIQNIKVNTFVPDVIINILIISSIPFIFYSFGKFWLASLVLWNSVLTLIFYISHIAALKNISNFNGNKNNMIEDKYLRRDQIQAALCALLFFPIFFMLNENYIFNSTDMNYRSEGVLSQLPLPFSIFSCMLGILLLSNFNNCKISTSFLFVFFIAMVFSSFANLVGDKPGDLGRLILLVQFCLPVFALILGQSYKNPNNIYFSYQSIGLFVLALVIPFEVIATILQSSYKTGVGFLSPYLYFFSVYQHLHYVPVILVGLYCICSPVSNKNRNLWCITLIISIFIGMYVVWSHSRLALILLGLNLIYWIIVSINKPKYRLKTTLFLVVILSSLFYGFKLSQPEHLELKYSESIINYFHPQYLENINSDKTLQLPEQENILLLEYERSSAMQVYWQKATGDISQFMFGNSFLIPKSQAISAFNYYLDLLYHFGFIALIPIIILLCLTIYRIYGAAVGNRMSMQIFTLSFVVLFFVYIDSSFKVTLRQPYPGIIVFFLWGVLLNLLFADKKNNSEA